MKFAILLITILFSSCVSYDYYRFEDDKKMLLPRYAKSKRYYKIKFSRNNLIFKNKDLQISAELEEVGLPCFIVSVNFKMFNDSVLINDFDIVIIGDTLLAYSDVFFNEKYSSPTFQYFKDIPQNIRLKPSKEFYFDYDCVREEEIELKVFLEYKVESRVFSDTIQIEGLKRVKGKKQFIPLH